jgi:hypothetical protein
MGHMLSVTVSRILTGEIRINGDVPKKKKMNGLDMNGDLFGEWLKS